MYALTMFKNIYDNQTDKRMDFSSWEQFEKLLYDLSKVKRKSKKDAQLISPATYQSDTTRANKNVVAWAGWAALDIDDHDFNGDLKNELTTRFGDFYYVCYSTASSTIDKPKFRVVFPLRRRVPSDRIRHFWYALNTEFGELGDKQTKDLSRMYYIPADYDSANNFIFTNNSGVFIDPDELMAKHPAPASATNFSRSFMDRLPEEIQKQVIKYRASAMEGNKNVNWTSYRDCPFVNQKLVKEYSSIAGVDGTGRYAMIYRIMTSIAINAIRQEYPISAYEIAELIRELDRETSNRYENRNLVLESDRAIEFAYRNL
jgi:hypothetical protein